MKASLKGTTRLARRPRAACPRCGVERVVQTPAKARRLCADCVGVVHDLGEQAAWR